MARRNVMKEDVAGLRNESVGVEIYDQVYQLKGPDPEYIERLAASVDAKMRAVSAQGSTVDSLRVAVLAALNLADELARLRARYETVSGSLTETQTSLTETQTSMRQAQTTMRSRAGSLAGMLDDILAEPVRRAG